MKFLQIAKAMEEIEKLSSRIEMTDKLADLLRKAQADEIDKIIYLIQGRVAPAHKGLEVGLGENFVVDAISKTTGYSEDDVKRYYKELGDLGLVAQKLVNEKKQRSLFTEELTLEKVFSNFYKISSASGPGSQELKIKLLAELINSAKPIEAKFIVRIPLNTLRLGIGDPTILDALAEINMDEFVKYNNDMVFELNKSYEGEELHRQIRARLRENIEDKYNIHSDLGFIAKKLKEGGLKALEEISIEPGTPIRPTLAERLPTAEEIIKKLGRCAVEGKLDGFRMQIHKNGDKVTIFSRRQENMTFMFPEIVDGIVKQIKEKVVIVEGEAIAYDENTGQFFPFQVTMQRKRKYDVQHFAEKYPLKLFLFDVMYVNGKSMMDRPFIERRKVLEAIVKEGSIVSLTELKIVSDANEIEKYFIYCIERGLEGVIAKDLNEKYIAGARKFAWIKLKRSYKGELSDTIDLVIIGYYKGRGARAKFGVGALLGAVYNSKNSVFESIAKVGSGLTEEQLTEFEKMLRKTKVEKKPFNVICDLEPDHWVEPKYVVEVIADEITKSPVHSCAKDLAGDGLALRFPRILRQRPDKKPEDATTTEEVFKMFRMQKEIVTDKSTDKSDEVEKDGS
ncbi:MAG: ATP-dependent DNA ligase [Candidatus Diapherotrites archaeon]|nr:ATP-dependent DNA ligase [Candidatus Diapherotrites archaeon]